MNYIKLCLLLTVVTFSLCSFKPTTGNIKAVQKAFKKDFSDKNVELIAKANNTYTLQIEKESVGTVYFRELTPKAETFTYAVAIANDGTILKLLFLDYPSSYGVQITKQQWGNKLKGKRPSELSVNNNVDAISGATLSINSLLNDLKNLNK